MTDEDVRHQTGLYFEIAKHFTTLNTAAILVYLAVGREASLPLWVTFFFVASLASATLSMLVTGVRGLAPTRTRSATSAWPSLSRPSSSACSFRSSARSCCPDSRQPL